jgi:hypothetical protein
MPWISGDDIDRGPPGSKGSEQDCVWSPHWRQEVAIIRQNGRYERAKHLNNIIPDLNVTPSRLEQEHIAHL